MAHAEILDEQQATRQSALADVLSRVEQARALRNSDPVEGIRLAREAVAIARDLVRRSAGTEATNALADALTALGHCERMTSALHDAAAHCSEAVALYESLPLTAGQAFALTQWGIVQVQLGDLTAGLARLERSRDISRALGDRQKESDALIDIGIVHNMLGDDDRAIALYEQALVVYEAIGDTYHAATCLNNMAYAHVCWGKREAAAGGDGARHHFEQAAVLAGQALPLARACDHIDFVATCLNTLSQAQRHSGDLDACMATLRQQLEISGQLVGRRMEAVCRATMADALLERDAAGDLDEAIRLLSEADDLCLRHSLRESQAPILESLALAQERAGEFAAALVTHRRFHALQMAVNSEAAEREARALESRLRLEWTEAELENAQQRERELAALNERLREQQVELEKFAHLDALTGLANRRAWLAGLEQQWSVDSGLYLLLLDIDHFKAINDDWGHGVGDGVLVAVADCLRAVIAAHGDCGRLGGEEFVAWCRLPAAGDMTAIAEAALQAVRQFDWNELAPDLRVTASLGWGAAAGHASVESALAEADRRMYEAKRNGRNRAVGPATGGND